MNSSHETHRQQTGPHDPRQGVEWAVMSDDPLDVCACGDYRRQHLDGTSRCLLGDLCTPYGCRKFRLFRSALGNSEPADAAEGAPLPDVATAPGGHHES